jgi:hypothetical protein
VMKKQTGIIAYVVSMILKAALLAAAWAGKSRRRGLELVAKMPIDEKDKEIVFLHDPIYQLETWVNIFQIQIQSSSETRHSLKGMLLIILKFLTYQLVVL